MAQNITTKKRIFFIQSKIFKYSKNMYTESSWNLRSHLPWCWIMCRYRNVPRIRNGCQELGRSCRGS
jgi:hypothetical protein